MNDSAGIHNIRIEGSYAKGVLYLRSADQLMLKLRSMLATQGIESGGLHEQFAEDVYAYARVGMGVAVVTIVADPDQDEAPEPEALEFIRTQRPDFLSGVVYRGFIEKRRDQNGDEFETLVDFRPSQRTGRLFDIGTARQESSRLAIKPDPLIAEDLIYQGNGAFVFSQYTILRPSMYSGTMKELVQTLMGYGKFSEDSIYRDAVAPVTDPNVFTYTPEYLREIQKRGTQIRFDWRFFRTHGLTRAADDRWWMVQISSTRGIHAMPLQLYESTTTDAFRQHVIDIGDEDALAVLDLFGGFPTGEGFPLPTEFDALLRAGLIVQGADIAGVSAFYANTWYSPWLGWAFSASGREAHNTAWRSDADGFQTGVHYNVRLTIGATEDPPAPSPLADSLKRHIYGARDDVGADFKKLIRGALFKIDRMSDEDVRGFLALSSAAAFSAINSRVDSPIADFTSPMALVSSSRIYMRSSYGAQFKFYDPAAGGIISHDGRASINADLDNAPETDATVHVFFVGESLHYAKLFLRPNGGITQEVEPGEGLTCGLIGQSVTTITTGNDGSGDGVYTESYDDRQTAWATRQTLTSIGTRIGPVEIQFGDDPSNPSRCSVNRTWAFRLEQTTVVESDGQRVTSAVAVPQGMREAYYYAARKQQSGTVNAKSVGFQFPGDAYSYTGWRNFPGLTGFLPGGCIGTPNFPSCWSLAEHPAGCGKVTDRHIWLEIGPDTSDCAALTNSGPWASPCSQIEPLVFSNRPQPVESTVIRTDPSSKLDVFFVSQNSSSPIATFTRTIVGDGSNTNGDPWFLMSPEDTDGPQLLYAQQNEMGTGDLIRYSEQISQPPTQLTGSPRFDDMENERWTFIGVING